MSLAYAQSTLTTQINCTELHHIPHSHMAALVRSPKMMDMTYLLR